MNEMPNSLSEWQRMFDEIYGAANRQLEPEVIWMKVVEELGEVATDLRKENYSALEKDLPDVFAWLCAFAERMSRNVEDTVWAKYPGVCPYCLKPEFCVCIGGTSRAFSAARIRQQVANGRRPVTLGEWENMFNTIYGNVNTIVMTPAVGFHLLEEVGEVAKALASPSHAGLDEGIADVFAWTIALSMKIDRFTSLETAVYEVYPHCCKRCNDNPCSCEGLRGERRPRG